MEFLGGAVMLGGLAFGGLWTFWQLQGDITPEAAAATSINVEIPSPSVVPPPPQEPVATKTAIATEIAMIEKPADMFLGVADEVLLEPLLATPITKVKFNKGGSSISLRIDFENGSRAAFKPRQTNFQSIPRREIVAFRINRLLGLSSVPPAVGRRFLVSDILDNLTSDSRSLLARLKAEMISEKGWVSGELSWWIPVIERGKIGKYDMDSMEGIVSWKRYLAIDAKIPKKEYALVSQISDMVVFDFLINNPDRWSGGNARVNEDQRFLYFMDNTMSFGDDPLGHSKVNIYLRRSKTFSRSLVNRLRTLDEDTVRSTLAVNIEPFRFLLRNAEIRALMSRRDIILEYIDSLIEEHGADKVLAFP